MCGIVAYIGNKDAYPILINGLKRLEYRGYDSAGVALLNAKNGLNPALALSSLQTFGIAQATYFIFNHAQCSLAVFTLSRTISRIVSF